MTRLTRFVERRELHPSRRQVLDALAAALHLDAAERAHLHQLAHATPVLGELTLRHVVLTAADDPEQKLVTFTADDADLSRIR